jgi:O-antigen/teichoic acid export membrane protein
MPGMSPPLPAPAATPAAPPVARVPRLLANTGWNLAGQVVPLLVGIAVLPFLIRALGLDRYGFLTLVWVLVGYASIFDFGIGRVLVRVVAKRLAGNDMAGAQHVARVGLTFMGLFGLVVGAVFALASAWLVDHVFKLPPGLHDEAYGAMLLLAASLPFVMMTTGYTGVLSAHQQFRGMNIVRALMGIASYLGPLAVALWLNRLDALVAFTLAMRVLGTLAHDQLARRGCGLRFVPVWPDAPTTREIFTLGGWISVSNLVSPLLTYLDRLLLGALVPVRFVAFYATPFDIVSKAVILPGALVTALFPTVAAVAPGSEAARHTLVQAVRLLFVLMLPIAFAFVVLARPGLQLWLGDEFATQAAPVLQILAVGVLFNTLAQGPAMLIQAAGQPRVMALLHVAELPVFVAVLYGLTVQFGIVGTALAAALRNGLDAIAVLVLARRDVAPGPIAWRRALLPAALAAALLGTALLPQNWPQTLALLLVGLLGFGFFAWHRVLQADERQRLGALVASAMRGARA